MDYIATHPSATIRYYASDMRLYFDSDAAYLVLPNARSRGAGYFSLSDNPDVNGIPSLKENGPILVKCTTLKNIISSAAKAETGTLFHNGKVAIPIRTTLHEMGHPQGPTYVKIDNSTTNGFVYSNIKPKRSKAWDMRYHWLKDKVHSKELHVY